MNNLKGEIVYAKEFLFISVVNFLSVGSFLDLVRNVLDCSNRAFVMQSTCDIMLLSCFMVRTFFASLQP